jgi:hypothetical protein
MLKDIRLLSDCLLGMVYVVFLMLFDDTCKGIATAFFAFFEDLFVTILLIQNVGMYSQISDSMS